MYLALFQNKDGNGQSHGKGGAGWDSVGEGRVCVEEKLHRRSNSCDVTVIENEKETMLF